MLLFVTLIVILANTTLGLIVYLKNPKSWTNRLFACLTTSNTLWAITNYLSLIPTEPTTALFYIRIVMATATLIFPPLYLLSKTLPSNQIQAKPIEVIFIFIYIFSIIMLSFTPLIYQSVIITNGNLVPIPGPAIFLYGLMIGVFLSLTIYHLYKRRQNSSANTRTQINLILLGIASTFISGAITSFFLVAILRYTQLVVLGPLFTLILIGFTGYAIVKHKFLDISFVVFRAVSFALLTAVIITLYAVGLFAVLKFIPINLYTSASIVLALILVYSFNPLKSVIEKLTKHIFYKQPYSSEDLLEELGNITRTNLNLDTLIRNTLDSLTSAMQVTKAGATIFLNEHDTRTITKNFTDISRYSDNTLHNLKQIAGDKPVYFDDLEEGPEKMLLRQLDLAVVVPLKVKTTLHGLLLFSQRSSGEAYSQQDVNVLDILTPQISVAVQNAKSYDEIKHFADTLKDEVDKATKNLKKANRDLRHLDKLKDEFVFIATHELKNPVTAMRGYLSMFKEGVFGPIPDKMKDPIDQLQLSNQQLVDLVNDLLQIARSEAKTLTFTTTKVELCPLINAIIGNVKPLYEQKGLKLVHACPNDKLTVKADENKVKEIVNNLVSNAIKYSDQGTIDITHQIKDGLVITHVKDQGVGIPQKDQEKIFSRFFRVEEEAAKGIPGTGLGLFIVKQLVEKMGGKIWFQSTVGLGTTFSFSLPHINK